MILEIGSNLAGLIIGLGILGLIFLILYGFYKALLT